MEVMGTVDVQPATLSAIISSLGSNFELQDSTPAVLHLMQLDDGNAMICHEDSIGGQVI